MGRKTEMQAGLRGRPPTGSLQLCSFVLGRQLSFWDRTFALLAGLHSVFFLLSPGRILKLVFVADIGHGHQTRYQRLQSRSSNTLLINEMLDSKHFFGIDRLDYSSYTLLIKECLISKQFFGISSLFCSSEKLLKLLTCRISGRWLC